MTSSGNKVPSTTETTPVDTDPGPVELHARNVSFDVADVDLHWIPGHPYASNLITALNLVLPEGERWFVKTFNEALPLVRDDELAASMRGFIGQEAMHADAHDKVVWNFVTEHGIDPEPYHRQMEWLFRKLLAPKGTESAKAQRKHLIERLWLIAAIEHYTAVLGDFALNSSWLEVDADPAMADLFLWHGAEEVEHRTVAHEVAVYFGDSYLRRGRAMLVAMPALLFVVFRGGRYISLNDPSGAIKQLDRFLQYRRGVRFNVVPKISDILLASLTYFRPGFDPVEVGDTAQAVAYLAKSPATRKAS
ncbi:metal-dependent hydrolase [Gordonia sp. TBRC 11910]|uniref:Metal-dependent hydrolase n=1 Tax=Gordonia asplenii TaxID=2725283 RepID=A0A848KUJ4_9ACTN|nr:metal-dependent hydrolase [Gordonia asplenii]NMO02554.1 metal-dependent hydrolase [Gordonia asplenii]